MRFSRLAEQSSPDAAENVVLDSCDRTILRELSRNGRISFRELAKAAHLSANATAERVRRLQQLGVLLGFSADVSPASLGLHLQAFVDVKLQKGMSMETFEKALSKIAGVREAASITGGFDARLRVVCRDTTQLGRLIEQIRVQTGVQETSSTVICRELVLADRGRN